MDGNNEPTASPRAQSAEPREGRVIDYRETVTVGQFAAPTLWQKLQALAVVIGVIVLVVVVVVPAIIMGSVLIVLYLAWLFVRSALGGARARLGGGGSGDRQGRRNVRVRGPGAGGSGG